MENVKKERHYGKVQMLMQMVKSNERRMNQTGFGHRFDRKEVAEWMECSEEEVDQIREICFLLSERGIQYAVLEDVVEHEVEVTYEQYCDDKKIREELYSRKWKEHMEYLEKHYPYPADVFLCAVDMNFLVKLNLGNI